jgi:energy-coupling factor transport system permease protein
MLIFGTFNALVDHYRLLRLAPRSLFHAGLAVTIAVAFVPSLLRSIGEIGEAQRARGHRFGRPRSWVALVSPLLAGSLEKSVQLAESLDSRGYGRTGSGDRAQGRAQLGVIAATLLLAGGAFGWLYYGGALALPASAMLAAGALALALTMRALGRQVRRSSYRRERWRGRDSLAALAALGCALALALLRLGDTGLVYYPFPQIAPPAFDLRAGLAVLLLAAPAALAPPPPPGRRRRAALRRAAAAPLTPCPSPSGGDGIPEQDAPESPSPLVGEGVGGFGATAAGRDVASALATGEAVCNLQ